MKLLGYKSTDKYFILETNNGERKISLKWRNIEEIKAKTKLLLNENIVLSTWGDWDNNIWFQDINKDYVKKVDNDLKKLNPDDDRWIQFKEIIDKNFEGYLNLLMNNNFPVPFDIEVELTKNNKTVKERSILTWKKNKSFNKTFYIHLLKNKLDVDGMCYVANNLIELESIMPTLLDQLKSKV